MNEDEMVEVIDVCIAEKSASGDIVFSEWIYPTKYESVEFTGIGG